MFFLQDQKQGRDECSTLFGRPSQCISHKRQMKGSWTGKEVQMSLDNLVVCVEKLSGIDRNLTRAHA